MGYSVRMLLDSVNTTGNRLTTWELTYPKFVHGEFMTHRLFSRNAASSRAIPTAKTIEAVTTDPAMPVWWGKNQAGMQAREELSEAKIAVAKADWLAARDSAVASVQLLGEVGLHKQIANRIIEPWMFITVICSATEYDNWFALRNHSDAQPEIAWVAREMHGLYVASAPKRLLPGQWHMPLIREEDAALPETTKRMASVGRCARVSYLTHDGRRDVEEDVALHNRLAGASPGHWSPFEHVARALPDSTPSGNFRGWLQYRKTFLGEHVGGIRQ